MSTISFRTEPGLKIENGSKVLLDLFFSTHFHLKPMETHSRASVYARLKQKATVCFKTLYVNTPYLRLPAGRVYPVEYFFVSNFRLKQGFTSSSTIGRGGDTTIPSPGRSLKQPLPGTGLHDRLHGRQACSEFNSFHQGVGQICPGRGYFRAVSSQEGTKLLHPCFPPNR